MTSRFIISLPVFFLIIVLSLPSFALEAIGEGSNQRQALNTALRNAVEMTMGIDVETNTLVENFQVVRQQILSHTKGFVKTYKVLSQEKSSEGIVRITIDAEVDNQSLKDSATALATLMKMSAHPRVFVAAINEGFDSVSSLNEEFHLLTQSVEATLRDDFHFNVLDSEIVRLSDKTTYRFSDRKNNLKRAKRAKATFVVFVEIVKASDQPFMLRLEGVDVANKLSLTTQEVGFAMMDWTRDVKANQEAILMEAKEHIYGPSAQVAAGLIKALQKESYENGQRFELSFNRFDEKLINFLETDLSNLNGYVRHKLESQRKNTLTLSYWSLLIAKKLF